MDPKKVIMGGAIIGSYAGSLAPLLWGGDSFSLASVFTSALGGFLGIYIAFKMTR